MSASLTSMEGELQILIKENEKLCKLCNQFRDENKILKLQVKDLELKASEWEKKFLKEVEARKNLYNLVK